MLGMSILPHFPLDFCPSSQYLHILPASVLFWWRIRLQRDSLYGWAGVAQLVEYKLPKLGVASSNLVARFIPVERLRFLTNGAFSFIPFGRLSRGRSAG